MSRKHGTRTKSLTDFERGRIFELSNMGCKVANITRSVGITVGMIYRYLRDLNVGTRNYNCGRKRMFSDRDKRRMAHLVVVEKMSTKEIARDPDFA
jgi:IS30 family transposase